MKNECWCNKKRTLVNFKTKRDVRKIEEDKMLDVRKIEEDKMLLCVRGIGKTMLLN